MNVSAQYAVDIINTQQKILPGRWIVLHTVDDMCDPSVAVAEVLGVSWEPTTPFVAMGGLPCSAVCKTIAPIADMIRLPLVSWGASLSELSDRAKYPRFFRTRMPEGDTKQAQLAIVLKMHWKAVAVLKGEPARFGYDAAGFTNLVESHGVRVAVSRHIFKPGDDREAFGELAAERLRIVVMYTYEDAIRSFLCGSIQLGYSGWILFTKMSPKRFWQQDWPERSPECTNELMYKQLDGRIQIGGLHLRQDRDTQLDCLAGMTAADYATWWQDYKLGHPDLVVHDAAFNAADGVCLQALAMAQLLGGNFSVEDLRQRKAAVFDGWSEALSHTSFQGVSGHIAFAGTGGLLGILVVLQTVVDSEILIGEWSTMTQTFVQLRDLIWPGGKANISAHFPECPIGTHADGIFCKTCAPGTAKGDSHNQECHSCVAGRYADLAGSSVCEVCLPGTHAAEIGATGCVACPDFFTSDGVECGFNSMGMLSLLAVFLLSFLVAFAVGMRAGVSSKVAEIMQVHGGVRVQVNSAHRIKYQWRGGCSTRVALLETGLRQLDGWDKGLRARVINPHCLELLDKDGLCLNADGLESSRGYMQMPFVNQMVDIHSRFFRLPVIVEVVINLMMLLPAAMISMATSGEGILVLMLLLGGLAVGSAGTCWRRGMAWRKPTPMQRRLQEYRNILRMENPEPKATERGPGRALSIEQLELVSDHFRSFISNRTMYYICKNIVLPMTEKHCIAFADVAGSKQTTWFTSHFWGTRFRDTISSLQEHTELCRDVLDIQECNYWVCTFSNNQWDIASEMGEGVTASSFYLALHSKGCHGTAMIVTDTSLPLERVWCLFEASITCQLTTSQPDSFYGLLLCTPSGVLNFGQGTMETGLHLAQQLITLDMRNASASNQLDKDMILAFVEKLSGGLDEVNRFVITGIRESLSQMHRSFEENFDGTMKDLLACAASAVRTTVFVENLVSRKGTASRSPYHASPKACFHGAGAEPAGDAAAAAAQPQRRIDAVIVSLDGDEPPSVPTSGRPVLSVQSIKSAGIG